MKLNKYLFVTAILAVSFLSACSTPELRKREGFLSNYNLLKTEDDVMWRYSSPTQLGQCKQFILSPVKVLAQEFDGNPVTDDQRKAVATYIQDAIRKSIGDKYPIVTEAGPNTGEIRIAITDAYRKGGFLGISVEGEVLDSSNTQVHAVMGSRLSEKAYIGDWHNAPVFQKMVDGWAQEFRQRLDETHSN